MLSDPKGTQAQGREEKPESGKEVKDTTLAPVESSSQTYNLSYSDGTNSVGIKTMVKDNTAVYSINMNIDFSQAGCVAEKLDPLIEEYRKIDPIKAGQLQGAIDFMFDIIEGIANFVENPIEGTIGLIKLGVIIATPPSAFAAEKAELLGAAGQAISSSTDKFIEGDAFTKSRMATYGALTVVSFAVGAGEAKAASSAGKAGEAGLALKSEVFGTELASQELIANVSSKREVLIAGKGTEEMRYLEYFGAEGVAQGEKNMQILLRENPSKVTVLEEFLHGTQNRLGIIDKGVNFAEWHVKDFMIRHSKLLGISAEDVSILSKERAIYLKMLNK